MVFVIKEYVNVQMTGTGMIVKNKDIAEVGGTIEEIDLVKNLFNN